MFASCLEVILWEEGKQCLTPSCILPQHCPASFRHPPGISSAPGLTEILGTSLPQDKAEAKAGRMVRFEGTSMQGLHRRRDFTVSFIKSIFLQDRKNNHPNQLDYCDTI